MPLRPVSPAYVRSLGVQDVEISMQGNPLAMTYPGHASDMDYLRLYAIGVGSLLAGAAVVHQIYKPDLVSCRSESTCEQVALFSIIYIALQTIPDVLRESGAN